MNLNIKKTDIQLFEDSGELFLEAGILIEGEGLCAIYSDGFFDFVCTTVYELDHILTSRNLVLKELKDERLCCMCKKPMQEGFYFESDGTQYCDEECLTKVISWEEYLELYDNGEGDAYWTAWED